MEEKLEARSFRFWDRRRLKNGDAHGEGKGEGEGEGEGEDESSEVKIDWRCFD